MEKTKPYEQKFLDFLTDMFHSFGLDQVSSKLLSILYFEPKEISMEKLAQRTGYSLASISTKTKIFQNFSCFHRVKKPGTKKVYLYMEKDIMKIQKAKIEAANQQLQQAKTILPGIIENYKKHKLSEEDKQKMTIAQNYYHYILKMEQILTKLKKLI